MKLTQLEFRDRFTLDEKRAIYAAAAVSVDIKIFLDDLAAVDPAVGVDTSDPRTVAGVQALESAGLVGEGRAAEILGADGPAAPPVGGFSIGQMVRILPPFGASFPGEYPVVGFGPECVELEMGQFAPSLLEAA